MNNSRSLKDLLLIHELIFIVLVVLAGAAGGIGIHLWDKSSQESHRISLLIQEMQQTRGDLYRQMKELFDAYFLADTEARKEYDSYTISIEHHFLQLDALAIGVVEHAAINELKQSYAEFVHETIAIFDQRLMFSDETLQRKLNSDLEGGIFERYERVTTRTERLLSLKQAELQQRQEEVKRTAIVLLILPMLLAITLLFFSRYYLKRAIVNPIQQVLRATAELSAGRLEHKVPETGAAELAKLSVAINQLAEELARSQEALIRTEKQAAQGLLVPMLAHNIRNPLASIRATAQVANSPDLDQEIRESLQAIISTVDRLERWTGSLLAYLHPLKPQPADTTIEHILKGALEPLLIRMREKSITPKMSLPKKKDVSMFTDEHLLEQALYNIMQNAIEAAPANSALDIGVEIAGPMVGISISDRGAGMPFTPDPHTLSPGPSTKRFGTGLGIPFAFKVCEALRGRIAFHHRDGGGTTIEFVVPRRYSPD
ncbi:MAG TPA: HAMP domain-containing sensor histidine kinase [Methylophilaceae bacterium]|nr:HAMP domain-containing sensor histidine kinase [Methylophilaceae bacterium]HZV61326.1 HAMP domain-containing sensor histidine kinase [Methylophilaceae bacterium]